MNGVMDRPEAFGEESRAEREKWYGTRGDDTVDNCLPRAIGMRGMRKAGYPKRRRREDTLLR